MPLVSALAASHAPNILLEPGAEWEDFMNLHYSMAPQEFRHPAYAGTTEKAQKGCRRCFCCTSRRYGASKTGCTDRRGQRSVCQLFWNNIPTFFVTIADEVKGQFTRHKFHYRNHKELGRAIVRAGMDKGIDLSFGEHIELQHTQNVPLYFLLPEPKIPILPIYVNTWVDPAPTPKRCYQVGELIREVATKSPERVAILATGGLSHFPGSPASVRSIRNSIINSWK